MDMTLTQERIIKASLLVFSQFGKAKSSMAMIAKKARVSKPLLFHHFGNKESLYQHCHQFMKEKLAEIKPTIHSSNSFFSALKQAQISNFDLEKNYPGILRFYTLDHNSLPKLPENPLTPKDIRQLKKGVSPQTLWQLLHHLSMGYRHALATEQNVVQLIKNFQETFAMLEELVIQKED